MPIFFLNKILSLVIPQRNFIIPEGTIIDGFVYAGTPGTIAGTINGDLFATAPIHISKTGSVNGNISAWDVAIFGTVNGNVTCNRKITLQPDCYVLGNVSAPEIINSGNSTVKGVITNNIAATQDVKSDFLQRENNMIKEMDDKETLMEAEMDAMKHWEEQAALEVLTVKPEVKIANWF